MKILNDELRKEIYDQYMDKDLRLSYKDLAIKYKICEKTVYNTIKQYGGNTKPKSKPISISKLKPISETTNKYVSSEPEIKIVTEPTPQRRNTKDYAEWIRREKDLYEKNNGPKRSGSWSGPERRQEQKPKQYSTKLGDLDLKMKIDKNGKETLDLTMFHKNI